MSENPIQRSEPERPLRSRLTRLSDPTGATPDFAWGGQTTFNSAAKYVMGLQLPSGDRLLFVRANSAWLRAARGELL
jgi:hypothetical protein